MGRKNGAAWNTKAKKNYGTKTDGAATVQKNEVLAYDAFFTGIANNIIQLFADARADYCL